MSWNITEEHKKTMSEFMKDFWSMIKASYEAPDGKDDSEDEHYWSTLVKWADALGKKYDCDPVISAMIIGYIDGQSNRQNGISVTLESDT